MARNSRFEVRGGSELEVCSIQSLEAALRGVDAKFLVDLNFGDCIRSWRLEVRGSLPLGFEVRSIQSLGVAEEGVDAKFDVKRAEIKQRRLPKYLRESTIFLPESKSKAEGSASTSYLKLNNPIPPNLRLESRHSSHSFTDKRALDDAAAWWVSTAICRHTVNSTSL